MVGLCVNCRIVFLQLRQSLNALLYAFLVIYVRIYHFCTHFPSNSYNGLARQMTSWAHSKRIQYWGAMAVFTLHAIGPGLSFLMGMYCYAKLPTPWSVIIGMALLIGGFLYPMMAYHRIVHPAKWPCPSMHGAFLFGITISMTFYYIQVLPNILFIEVYACMYVHVCTVFVYVTSMVYSGTCVFRTPWDQLKVS